MNGPPDALPAPEPNPPEKLVDMPAETPKAGVNRSESGQNRSDSRSGGLSAVALHLVTKADADAGMADARPVDPTAGSASLANERLESDPSGSDPRSLPIFAPVVGIPRKPDALGQAVEQVTTIFAEALRKNQYLVLACADHEVARDAMLMTLARTGLAAPLFHVAPASRQDSRTVDVALQDLLGPLLNDNGRKIDGEVCLFLGREDEWWFSRLACEINEPLDPASVALAARQRRHLLLAVDQDWPEPTECPHRCFQRLNPLVPRLVIELGMTPETLALAERLEPLLGAGLTPFLDQIRGKGEQARSLSVQRLAASINREVPELIASKVAPEKDVCLATATMLGAFLCQPEGAAPRGISLRVFAEAGRAVLHGRESQGPCICEVPSRTPLAIWNEETDRLRAEAGLLVQHGELFQSPVLTFGAPREAIRSHCGFFLSDCLECIAGELPHWVRTWPAAELRIVARAVAEQAAQSPWDSLPASLRAVFLDAEASSCLDSPRRVVAEAFAERVALIGLQAASQREREGAACLLNLLDHLVWEIGGVEPAIAVALRGVFDRARPAREQLHRLLMLVEHPQGHRPVLQALRRRLQSDPLEMIQAVLALCPKRPEQDGWKGTTAMAVMALFEFYPFLVRQPDGAKSSERHRLTETLRLVSTEVGASIVDGLLLLAHVPPPLDKHRSTAMQLLYALFDVTTVSRQHALDQLWVIEQSLNPDEADMTKLPSLGLSMLLVLDWLTAESDGPGVLAPYLYRAPAERRRDLQRDLRRAYDLLGACLDAFVQERRRDLQDPILMLRRRRRHLLAVAAATT